MVVKMVVKIDYRGTDNSNAPRLSRERGALICVRSAAFQPGFLPTPWECSGGPARLTQVL